MIDEREMIKLIRERYPNMVPRHLRFVLEYVRTGDARQSYINTNSRPVTLGSASALASKILRDYNISLMDFLDITGHSEFSIVEALNSLKVSDPDKYLSHIEKLRKLDNSRVEIDIRSLPVIEITQNADIHSS